VSFQFDLFSRESVGPPGLRYQGHFISEDEEQDLIARIRDLPLTPFQFGAFEGKRRIASFGWRYDYSVERLEHADDLPAWITPLLPRIEAFASLPRRDVRQVLCTEYDKGVGIGWHRDKPHFGLIFGLSLASACKFRLRRKVSGKSERFTLEAQPRSLYMISGEARQVWKHSIAPVETVRYSVTFRTMATEHEPDR
jgi:alkylated DNA repair dioxygenase AlkB